MQRQVTHGISTPRKSRKAASSVSYQMCLATTLPMEAILLHSGQYIYKTLRNQHWFESPCCPVGPCIIFIIDRHCRYTFQPRFFSWRYVRASSGMAFAPAMPLPKTSKANRAPGAGVFADSRVLGACMRVDVLKPRTGWLNDAQQVLKSLGHLQCHFHALF